jgi:hypothetical protein
MGTNASIVMGQSFDISYGPPKIEFHGGYQDHIATSILLGVLGVGALAFAMIYDAIRANYSAEHPNKADEQSGDRERASWLLAFQVLTDALLITVLEVEMALKIGNNTLDEVLEPLFRVGTGNEALDNTDWGIVTFGAAAAIFGVIMAPLEAIGGEAS